MGSPALVALSLPIFNIDLISLRQAITPDRLQGRVNAAARVIAMSMAPVGALLGGYLGSGSDCVAPSSGARSGRSSRSCGSSCRPCAPCVNHRRRSANQVRCRALTKTPAECGCTLRHPLEGSTGTPADLRMFRRNRLLVKADTSVATTGNGRPVPSRAGCALDRRTWTRGAMLRHLRCHRGFAVFLVIPSTSNLGDAARSVIVPLRKWRPGHPCVRPPVRVSPRAATRGRRRRIGFVASHLQIVVDAVTCTEALSPLAC